MPETNTSLHCKLSEFVDRKTLLAVLACHGYYNEADSYWTVNNHNVEPNDLTCDCGSYFWNDTMCKHILYVLLREGNIELMQLLAQHLQEL